MTESAPATNRLRRYRSPCLLILPSLSLPPLECCFGTSPIQAEKFRPDRKAFGSATLATRAVASAGPTPGISSSRLLVSLDRCQAMIWRSKFRICGLSVCSIVLLPLDVGLHVGRRHQAHRMPQRFELA